MGVIVNNINNQQHYSSTCNNTLNYDCSNLQVSYLNNHTGIKTLETINQNLSNIYLSKSTAGNTLGDY